MNPVVCHVSQALCPRIIKLATVFGNHKWIGAQELSFQDPSCFTEYAIGRELRFGGISDALEKIECDIYQVHTHGKDEGLVPQVMGRGKPVIWDVHDYYGEGTYKPDMIFAAAPAIGRQVSADLVYFTLCPEKFKAWEKFEVDVVICTGLSNIPNTFRYWADVFGAIVDAGYSLRVFSSSVRTEPYRNFDIRGPLPVAELIGELAKGRVGLAGSPFPDWNMLGAYPNKLFEYGAAGIPVVWWGSKHEIVPWLRMFKQGVCDDIEGFKIAIAGASEPFSFMSMEDQIPGIAQKYWELMK